MVGRDEDVEEARCRIEHLLGKLRKGREVDTKAAEEILLGPVRRDGPRTTTDGRATGSRSGGQRGGRRSDGKSLPVRPFEPRNDRQRRYLEAIERCSLTFGIGAAGTGKTFLAVGAALRALRAGNCRRLIVTRPVVEAGEHLGFLPGDLQAKVDPYMRPVYDALRDLTDFEDLEHLEERGIIEVAPLAYMRGRTLSDAFVILDEAQNTTVQQMKMFLTRMGEGSHMVISGDPSQTDLPRGQRSGLGDAVARLQGFHEVGVVEFGVRDVCRHPLVAQIIRAYEGPARPQSQGGGRGRGEGGDSPAEGESANDDA